LIRDLVVFRRSCHGKKQWSVSEPYSGSPSRYNRKPVFWERRLCCSLEFRDLHYA
jgi:hypothetical protein